MKNTIKLFGIIALVAVIGLSMTALSLTGCGNPAGGGGRTSTAVPEPTSAKYESKDAEGNTYILEISKPSSKAAYSLIDGDAYVLSSVTANGETNSSVMAAYAPKGGDAYVLTIITAKGETKKSSGTVAVSSAVFTLTPAGSDKTFTVTIAKTDNGTLLMTEIKGTVTLTSGDPITVSASVIPIREYEKFELLGNLWSNAANTGDSGESWFREIPLSDFTVVKPKKGDKLKFNISGKVNKPLVNFVVNIENHTDDWSGYQWLGGAGNYKIEASENFNKIFEINIGEDPLPYKITLAVGNMLWYTSNGGSYVYESGIKGVTKQGAVMATISNFKISLLK